MEWGVVQYPGLLQPVGDPSNWVEPVWFEAWQNLSTWLMPTLDPRFVGGDISNYPYQSLQLVTGIHFGPNASGDFADPGSFDITVKSGEFEIRSPL